MTTSQQRTTADWVKELSRSKRGTPMHTAITEIVRLHRAFPLWAEQLDALAAEMQAKGYHGNAEQITAISAGITHILEGKNHD